MCRTVIYVVVSLFNYLFAASIHELGAKNLFQAPRALQQVIFVCKRVLFCAFLPTSKNDDGKHSLFA